MIPFIDKAACSGCGACAEVCPPQAIEIHDDKATIVDELCEECGFCAAECPLQAITIVFPVYEKQTG